jgi:hypothetical protein
MPVPTKFRENLKRFGNDAIDKMYIQRTPVGKAMVAALDLLSEGKFKKNMKQGSYDTLYHLSLIIELKNGKRIMTDKTDTLNINERPTNEGERIPLPFKGQLTLATLMTKTRNLMGAKWYEYDSQHKNCQNYLISIVKSNGLNTPAIEKFIVQSTSQLFEDTGNLRVIAKFLTDAGRVSKTVTEQSVSKSFKELGEYMKGDGGKLAQSYARRLLADTYGGYTAKTLEGLGDDILKLNMKQLGKDLEKVNSIKLAEDMLYSKLKKVAGKSVADKLKETYQSKPVKKVVKPITDAVTKVGDDIKKIFKKKKPNKKQPTETEDTIQKDKPVDTIDRQQVTTFL